MGAKCRAVLLFLLSAWFAYGQSGTHQATQPSEYQVKAAFLLNFTKFIEWPESQFADADAPLTICILGEDPFGTALDEVIAGELINGRKVIVERLKEQPSSGCQVLFVNKPEKDARKIATSSGPGVLTIGEGKDFIDAGGIIAFVVENRRVRFDINQRAAQRSNLRISSRLLSVARVVER